MESITEPMTTANGLHGPRAKNGSLIHCTQQIWDPELHQQVASDWNIDPLCIEEIRICIPIQSKCHHERNEKQAGQFMESVLDLKQQVSLERLHAAWKEAFEATALSRTRTLNHERLGVLQVVLKEESLEGAVETGAERCVGYPFPKATIGEVISSFRIAPGDKERGPSLTWTIHSSLFDPSFLSFMTRRAGQLYMEQPLSENILIGTGGTETACPGVDQLELYWTQALEGCDPVHFPISSSPQIEGTQERSRALHKHTSMLSCMNEPDLRSYTLVYAAWALVMLSETSSEDVVFGGITPGRQSDVQADQSPTWSTMSITPIRIQTNHKQHVFELLKDIDHETQRQMVSGGFGLSQISKLSSSAEQACGFRTLLAIYSTKDELHVDPSIGTWRTGVKDMLIPTYPLTIQVCLTEDGADIFANYDSQTIDSWTIARLLKQFSFLMKQLAEVKSGDKVTDLLFMQDDDLQRIWAWNADIPDVRKQCIHDLIEEQTELTPDALAIEAWDGTLTYKELSNQAAQLASQLVGQGVQPGDVVSLCFDKSMWTIVAMLAVLKAGGAFCMLDPAYPERRLKEIVRQTNANIILSSVSNISLASRLGPSTVPVGPGTTCEVDKQTIRGVFPRSSPGSLMYIAFTSGSTGTPKGSMISHSAFCSAIHHQASQLDFSAASRVLDISSYVFDLWIHSTGATLTVGGCLCIPSESERKDPTSCIQSMDATYTITTPTVARLIKPGVVPSLKTLALIGEPLTVADIERWRGNIHVVNTYGPAECTTMTTMNKDLGSATEMTGIGKGAGVVTWVVDPDDHIKLVPPGVTGELLLEGPLLANGYLDDPERTAEAFIKDPKWLVSGALGYTGRSGRLYKTGDLVRYREDGSFTFISRKDSQVKIRGQRLELGEVEHHVRECMEKTQQLAVESIVPSSEEASPMLAIFFSKGETGGREEVEVLPVPADLQQMLTQRLPDYMIPTVCICLSRLPLTATDKINRKKLRDIGASLSMQHLADNLGGEQTEKRMLPSTSIERILRELWAQVLHIRLDTIGLDDSFFRLGGNSIIAMRLVAAAREVDVQVTVADVFERPRLSALAERATVQSASMQSDVPPFSLVQRKHDALEGLHAMLSLHGLDPNLVEDIYPCTPLQEGLLALTAQRPSEYISRSVLEISAEVDLVRFKDAWEHTVRVTPILRTRAIQHKTYGLLQVIMRDEDSSVVEMEGDFREHLASETTEMGLGQPLNRLLLIRGPTGKRWLIWTKHHALYDGASVPLIMDLVDSVYEGGQGDLIKKNIDFKYFIRHLQEQNTEKAQEFWRSQFTDYNSTPFPSLSAPGKEPQGTSKLERICSVPSIRTPDITIATFVQAAWALAVYSRTGVADVVFGAIVSGRNAPIPMIESMIGPTIATVPTRVRFQSEAKLSEFLGCIQRQMTSLIPYEQTGLQRIRKTSRKAERACDFQTLLVLQPEDEHENTRNSKFGTWQDLSGTEAFSSYALTLDCVLKHGRVDVMANYDPEILDDWTMERILDQFSFLIQQLPKIDPDQPLKSLKTLPHEEEEVLWDWSENLPGTIERCAHEIILEQVRMTPERPAVDAWDGEMTYGELGVFATRLAHYLVDREASDIVLLCFEKSMWTTVAVLAVLQSGRAICMVEPRNPESRLQEIVRQTGSDTILCSTSQMSLSSKLVPKFVPVGSGMIPVLQSEKELPQPDPSSLMYVVFTSGSTGQPKGVLIPHSSFCSGIHYQALKQGIKPSSRVLDFTTHAFDVFIYNTGATLANGGCLCVPSEAQWKDDPTNCIRSMEATYIDLTPSIARLIDPSNLPSIQTVILGGEPCTVQDVERWPTHANVVNAYGPSECTANSVINPEGKDPLSTATQIGKGAGVVTWVIDSSDNRDSQLVPLGVVGELLLEGPLVGNGYLNDIERTTAAFIEDPPWLLQGTSTRPGRHGRLYRTGDLVKYGDDDGGLVFVGRKDTQVKIRGQRIELGEVEHHARDCIPEASHVAAEIFTPSTDGANAVLAVFVLGETDESGIRVLAVPTDVEEKLTERLPSYMIPTVLFVLRHLPTTVTGKIDRSQLRRIGASYSAQQLADLCSINRAEGEKQMPSTDVEHALQQLFSQVLAIDARSISVDDSFFRLGGDSITAMQISFEARSLQIQVSTRDILQKKTIHKICQNLSAYQPSSNKLIPTSDSFLDRPFGLTPVQQLYLGLQDEIHACFDQYFYLKLREKLSAERLSAALETLVGRHDVLRARLTRGQSDEWQQVVIADSSGHVHVSQCTNPATVPQSIAQARGKLDIVNGPVLGAVLIEDEDKGQSLFITIHHFVIDLVSWRMLLQELEHILRSQPLSPLPAVTFQSWCITQASYVSRQMADSPSLPFEVRPALLSYWGMESVAVLQDTMITTEFNLEENVTEALFGNTCNDAMKTRPLELMIALLIHSFSASFPDRVCPPVFNETHGREIWTEDIDLSRTLGWFTSMFPVQLDQEDGSTRSLQNTIRKTKDCMRGFAHNGWLDFAGRFADEKTARETIPQFPLEICFNYLGVYQQLEKDDSFFRNLPLPQGCEPPSAARVSRFALVDVNFGVWEGRANVAFSYDRRMKYGDAISSWIRLYEEMLNGLPERFSNTPSQWTLCDFPLAFRSYDNLDAFDNDILPQLGIQHDEVEDIFPCSPMQQGILLSQAKDAAQYRSCIVYEVTTRAAGEKVDIFRLKNAWKAVIRRHAILRTILVDEVPGSSKTLNLVLRDPQPTISTFSHESRDSITAKAFRENHDPAVDQRGRLPHHLSICQSSNDRVYLCLDINHAIIDGHSQGLVQRDLKAAYDHILNTNGPSYRNLIHYLEGQSFDDARQYWKNHLSGRLPCLFPSMVENRSHAEIQTVIVPNVEANEIRTFCSEFDMTLATVVQKAWAMVLSRYTGSTHPCFGVLASGRDLPIDEVDEIVGPLINMLVCQVQLDSDQPHRVLDVLNRVRDDYTTSLPYQSVSLAEVHRILGLGSSALFNTQVTAQKLQDNPDEPSTSGITLHAQDDLDPTEYDIVIRVGQARSRVEIAIDFRTSCLTHEQAQNVASCLGQTIQAITADPMADINDLNIISHEDKETLWAWNAEVPHSVDQCLHELIEEHVQTRPQAIAVQAWDGTLTYNELSIQATQLAYRLVDLGVSYGTVLPLCFEKSVWTSVAILAVLKAGGAICMLDPNHPERRLQEIVQQTRASIVLSSVSNLALSSRLGSQTAISVGPEPNLGPFTGSLPRPNPSAPMYIVFSSGSTGTPKGSIISHLSFCTGLYYQSKPLRFHPDTRCYEFAAHAFDIFVYTVGLTLTSGGCLYVPSEADRRDHLTESIYSSGPTHLLLTPSVSRLIRPEMVPSVNTIIFAGEACSVQDVERWSKFALVINTYGPSECTPSSVINYDGGDPSSVARIGTGVGATTWVVDPNNHDKLMPIGTVGELLLEGPLVGDGYLDAEKTVAAFIEDPTWLRHGAPGHPGRSGRLYKTGDLVRYHKDGSLIYVGRKDTQVKIRGQRVELGEVEHHARQCMPLAAQADQLVAEAITPAGETSSPFLAIFISDSTCSEKKKGNNGQPLINQGNEADLIGRLKVLTVDAEAESNLAERLPSYMVPSICFVLPSLPKTATDKIDRKKLREIGASLSSRQLADLGSSSRKPSTETETKLLQVWARVLDLDPASIGMDDSFFRLGGDSITAMQISFEARLLQIPISTSDILRQRTIGKLSQAVTTSIVDVSNSGLTEATSISTDHPFGLTPIQKLYIGLQGNVQACFDQCFYLEIQRKVNADDVSKALGIVVNRHPMLRARFVNDKEGKWQQYIVANSDIRVERVDKAYAIEAIIRCRGSLDILDGPVLGSVLVDNDDGVNGYGQCLFISIHHLVVDLVSWRVLLQELERTLTSQALPPLPPVSFSSWSAMQARYTVRLHSENNLVCLPFELNPSFLSYWGLASDYRPKQRTTVTEEFVLDDQTTGALLSSCNEAFQTRPFEIMVAALIYSFSEVFHDRPCPPVFNETHGREVWSDTIDLSQTVGWFTSIFPIQISSREDTSLLGIVRRTKDIVRSSPHSGWSYFASQFVDEETAASSISQFPVEVLFNYQGLYQQLERSGSLFKEVPLPDGCDPGSAGDVVRFSLFDVDIHIQEGRIHGSFTYDREIGHRHRVQSWVQVYKRALEQLPELLNERSVEWTLSDLPLAFKTYNDLHYLQKSLLPQLGIRQEDVEDLFPCSPLQQGIWVSQSKDSGRYRTCSIVEVLCTDVHVDIGRLQDAWRGVTQKHAILRTIILYQIPGSSRMFNLVLKETEPSVSFFRTQGDDAAGVQQLRELYKSSPIKNKTVLAPLHHLSICQVEETGKVFFSLEINHVLIDAESRRLVMRDLQTAYEQTLTGSGSPYRNFISYLEQQPQERAREFWARYLGGAEPCYFPKMTAQEQPSTQQGVVELPVLDTDEVHALCRKYEITLATVIQTAWALVLSRYTGSQAPCFGNLSSGRDLPIDGVDHIVGPMVSMLACRVKLSEVRTVRETLRAVHTSYVESLPHQSFPLADIHQALQLGSLPLFNTALSIQKLDNLEASGSSIISFRDIDNYDPTEYAICVYVDHSKSKIDLAIVFDTEYLTQDQANDLATNLNQAIHSIVSSPESAIMDLDINSEKQKGHLWALAGDAPPRAEWCFHQRVENHAFSHPGALAVCAWDGELTYRDLNAFSTCLAHHLIIMGAKPGMIIPLCFEKSMWTIVAVLAVIKAGGAFCMLETTYPENRLRTIVRQTRATLILSSFSSFELSSRLTLESAVVPVGPESDFLVRLDDKDVSFRKQPLPFPDPSSIMCVAFTSGSTGQPKGAMISHGSFSTAINYQAPKLNINPASRVLDVSSYAFDLWIHCMGVTLATGGCLCIPSDTDRRDNITECIRTLEATYTIMTPTVARLIQPEMVPSLEILGLAGEPPTVADIQRWRDGTNTRVVNLYGPAECTTLTVLNIHSDTAADAVRIGKGVGVATWVADPSNHDRLMPFGLEGELLLEGPLVGDGYLNEPEKTASAFINDPLFLSQGTKNHPGRSARLYKTGDLVRYHEDGSLVYIGRKDNQVKVRGQRVELSEVEHQVRQCISWTTHAKQLAAEMITPMGEGANAMLAIFLSDSSDTEDNHHANLGSLSADIFKIAGEEIGLLLVDSDTEDKLAEYLPNHMLPSIYLVLPRLPTTATEKIDRRKLRELGASLTNQQLANTRSHTQGNNDKQLPTTHIERIIQSLWADILSIDPSTIGKDDSFFQLGGDSFTAMSLVAAAREAGLSLSVADVFKQPRLSSQAQCASMNTDALGYSEVPPFSLIGGIEKAHESLSSILPTTGLRIDVVEDAYPCAPLQEGLLASTAKHAGDYVLQSVMNLPPEIDIKRFRDAWERATQMIPILRTRVIHHEDHGLLQVVIKEDARWTEEIASLEIFLSEHQTETAVMGLGQPLNLYKLVRDPNTDQAWFIWTIHHALYDGASLSLILDLVSSSYRGLHIDHASGYNRFIQYLSKESNIEAVEQFWKSEFSGCQFVPFPPLPSSVTKPMPDAKEEKLCVVEPVKTPDITMATVVRASWAAVVHSRTAIPDVVFGTTVSGRDVPVPGIESILGPTIATVPTRIRYHHSRETVAEYLQGVQDQMTGLIPHQHLGLHRISKINAETEQACQFQTLLVIQPAEEEINKTTDLGEWRDLSGSRAFGSYGLVLNCFLSQNSVSIVANYDSNITDYPMIKRLLDQFSYFIQELASSNPDRQLSSIDTVSPEDKDVIWLWNDSVPKATGRCIHELIEGQVEAQPDALAIDAWDGKLTYRELDTLTSRLARRLVSLRVGPGVVVPLYFEKSVWAVVSMLGVLKAGNTICMLEPTHPQSRLQTVVQQVGATVILSSMLYLELSSQLVTQTAVLPVGPELLTPDPLPSTPLSEPADKQSSYDLPPPDPSSTMYIVFTSGSTGLPKGAFVSHSSFCTGVEYQTSQLGFTTTSRVLDFASYAFDMPVHLAGATLATGGCLCILSEQERKNDLAESIIRATPTIVVMTPSIARLIQPEAIPSVKTVILGGESLTLQDAERWWDYAAVRNVYGPSECTPLSVINCDAQDPSSATHIGKGVGVVTWLADPDDFNKLVPLGAVGAILLEGPLLGSGYLNNPEKTEATYKKDPLFLLQGTESHPQQEIADHSGRTGTIYRTGDLARYHEDGSLIYVGRKDTQVKIRGQRVELGEVEHHIRMHMPRAQTEQLAAEVIRPADDPESPVLAIFLSGQVSDEDKVGNSISVLPIPLGVEEEISKHIPRYMIPTVCFIMPRLPTTTTDKIDRKKLREAVAHYTTQELADLRSLTQDQKRIPSTEMERTLQHLWARVLGIDATTIGADDSFFRLGGDSITAMKTAAQGRIVSVDVTVADIFQKPQLSVLAEHILTQQGPRTQRDVPAFSMVNNTPSIPEDLDKTLAGYRINPHDVEDIYPCTPLQEGLLALSTKYSSDYVLQSVLQLSPDVDLGRFCEAWEHAVEACAILRTRIVHHDAHGLLQVVIREGLDWAQADNLEYYLNQDQEATVGLGKRLVRYCLIKEPETGRCYFVLTIHHALYDGASLPLILDLVEILYSEGRDTAQRTEFKYFIRYLQDQDMTAAELFWKPEFTDCQNTPFPVLPSPTREPIADSILEQFTVLKTVNTPDITLASVVRAAWALVQSSHTSTPDIVFGTTVSGRQAPVPGIETMMGPTIATVPTRVQVRRNLTVKEYLEEVQRKMTTLIPYEQTGLQRIARVSTEAKEACNFQTLLVVQPPSESNERLSNLGVWRDVTGSEAFNSYALTLNCFLDQDKGGLSIITSYDSSILNHQIMKRILDQFGFLANELASASPDRVLGTLDMITKEERETLWNWNQTVPAAVERCLHKMVKDQVQQRPQAIAVHAWDGKLTYAELDTISTQLTHHLITLGVSPGMIIPLCFEKSMWTTVAVLAVLKTGCAICMLEPSHPMHRLQTIKKQIGATIVLTSELHYTLGSELAEQAIQVGPGSIPDADPESLDSTLPEPDPASLMYVIFSSGTTGLPKASLISHTSYCSGIFYQSDVLGFTPTSRAYDFSAYVFDVFVYTFGITLANGGCLCVPSEADRRNELTRSIQSMSPTHLLLTPSVARLVEPEAVPTVETIVLTGEACSVQDIQRWKSATVRNGSSPSECTSLSVINGDTQDPQAATRIGKGMGAATWVVDPDDHNSLMPLGAVGELLLEGPLLGDGYLGDPGRTAATFIQDPEWLIRGADNQPGRHGRLYKTGDLVRYHVDNGDLIYVGRKDTQVKIRGQRVELGEIEHHVRRFLPEATHAKYLAAEMFTPAGADTNPVLAVFFSSDEIDEDTYKGENSAKILTIPTNVLQKLAEHLPSYMVPTMCFVLPHRLPTTISDKTDRKRLREIGASYSAQELADLRSLARGSQLEKRLPSTSLEQTLQQLWARTLTIEEVSIGVDDNFFQLGGDSIAAMKLVVTGREAGLHFSVTDIFRHPTIQTLAEIATSSIDRPLPTYEPFSLISQQAFDRVMSSLSDEATGIDPSNVEDILPTTASQKRYLRLCMQRPTVALNYFQLHLGSHVDIGRLKRAFQQLPCSFPILRTIFLSGSSVEEQVVLQDLDAPLDIIQVDEDGDLDSAAESVFLEAKQQKHFPGRSFVKFVLLCHATYGYRLVVQISHAQYDGISLPLMLKALFDAYHDREIPFLTSSFSNYIAYIQSQKSSSVEYWRKVLQGSQITSLRSVFHSNSTKLYGKEPVLVAAEGSIPVPTLPPSFTMAMLTSSAWSIVLSELTGQRDVVYGQYVSGRNSAIPGVQEIIGPCLNIVPVRVQLHSDEPTTGVLTAIRDQFFSLGESDSLGLDFIIKDCTDWDPHTKLDSVVHHVGSSRAPSELVEGDHPLIRWLEHENHYPAQLEIISEVEEGQLALRVVGDSSYLEQRVANNLLHRLLVSILYLSLGFDSCINAETTG